MGRSPKVALCILIVCKVLLVRCDYISVVGSQTLRIDEPYKVAITSHSALESQTISVGIIGSTYSGDEYELFKQVSVAPGQTVTTKLIVRKGIFRHLLSC